MPGSSLKHGMMIDTRCIGCPVLGNLERRQHNACHDTKACRRGDVEKDRISHGLSQQCNRIEAEPKHHRAIVGLWNPIEPQEPSKKRREDKDDESECPEETDFGEKPEPGVVNVTPTADVDLPQRDSAALGREQLHVIPVLVAESGAQ